jgi:hypothetical protein
MKFNQQNLGISNFVMYSFLSFIIFLASSCSNKRAMLEQQAKLAVSKDITNVTAKCVDGLTAGMGSLVLDMVISKGQRDSLILKPLIPYIDKELKTKSDEELTAMTKSTPDRIKFIGGVLVHNKDNIVNTMSKEFSYAKAFVDLAIQLMNAGN